MDQAHLQLVLGIKLHEARLKKKWGLKQLSQATGISISYLNEIEKGKKYPKADKLLQLASALDLPFEKLVSPKVGKGQHPLSTLLQSPGLSKFPFDLFGVTFSDVVHLLSQAPKEASALIRAILSIARAYDMSIEHFFHAALRAFQELHGNYFADLEAQAQKFCDQQVTEKVLLHYLETQGIEVSPLDTGAFRSVFVAESKKLLIRDDLEPSQRKFLLARECAYFFLELSERACSSPPINVETFQQVLNDFKASYFAGALLLPSESIVEELDSMFGAQKWCEDLLLDLLKRFEVTPELFFYRLSQVLPGQLHANQCHFLKFQWTDRGGYKLVKELNMNQLSIPVGLGLKETFCRRWLSLRVIRELRSSKKPQVVGIQRSRFLQGHGSFLCIAMAFWQGEVATSLTLGFRLDKASRRFLSFSEDPAIAESLLGGTCERCPLDADSCSQRKAPPEVYNARLNRQQQRVVLDRIIEKTSKGGD